MQVLPLKFGQSRKAFELEADRSVVGQLEAHLARTKQNLRVFETYASTQDPRREKVEGEIKVLEEGLERLKA